MWVWWLGIPRETCKSNWQCWQRLYGRIRNLPATMQPSYLMSKRRAEQRETDMRQHLKTQETATTLHFYRLNNPPCPLPPVRQDYWLSRLLMSSLLIGSGNPLPADALKPVFNDGSWLVADPLVPSGEINKETTRMINHSQTIISPFSSLLRLPSPIVPPVYLYLVSL